MEIKICDNCEKRIDDFLIELQGYKVENKENLGYAIKRKQEFCSFNCLSEYAKKEQKLFEEAKKCIEKYMKNNEEE